MVSVVFGTVAFGQSADWLALFRELVSPDPAVSDAARARSFNTLIPKLEAADPTSLDEDITAILEAFSDEEPIRLQASGLLTVLALNRPDGSEALKRAVPVFLSQFKDQNRRVRCNAIMAIASLRPQVPREALTPLLIAVRDYDPPAMGFAVLGLARLAETAPEAADGLASLLAANEPIEIRRIVVQSIGKARVQNPVIVAKIGEVLQDKDRDLVRDAIDAVSRIGPAAKPLKPILKRIADTERDEELSNAAAAAALRLER
jgi:HEAT repeat protein